MARPPIAPATSSPDLLRLAESLAEVGDSFARRGWMLGTSGSLSIRTSAPAEPLSLLVTVSGLDKGDLQTSDFLEVRDDGAVFETLGDPRASSESLFLGDRRPSGEVLVHRAIYQAVEGAGAVFHTHSVHATLASRIQQTGGALRLPPVEMLKGIGRWDAEPASLPLVDNLYAIPELAELCAASINPRVPGVLVRDHGLYVWGPDRPRARRHVECLEFVLEVIVRARAAGIDLP